jgi:hypothetical protein
MPINEHVAMHVYVYIKMAEYSGVARTLSEEDDIPHVASYFTCVHIELPLDVYFWQCGEMFQLAVDCREWNSIP